MKTALTTLATLALAIPAIAQGPVARGGLTTTTDYAVFASAANTTVNGVASGTSLPPLPFAIRAAEGGAGRIVAAASTTVEQPPILAPGTFAVQVMENGRAFNNALTGGPSAGTSNALGRPSPGAHGLSWHLAAIPAGTTVTVNVGWTASATANASTGVSVDVDGDGTADFQHRVSGGRDQQRQSFSVVAGTRGLMIGIDTSGLARTTTPTGPATGTQESYDADLFIAVTLSGGGPNCAFRPFGPECTGKLTGSLVPSPAGTRPGIGFRLTGAPAGGVALFVVGDALAMPLPLPGSRCALLVNPRAVIPQPIDANGGARLRTPLPRPPFSIDVQAVTVELRPSIQLGSSNAVNASCR